MGSAYVCSDVHICMQHTCFDFFSIASARRTLHVGSPSEVADSRKPCRHLHGSGTGVLCGPQALSSSASSSQAGEERKQEQQPSRHHRYKRESTAQRRARLV